MKDKKIIVLYHANCPDGFGSCFSFWLKYKNDALYIPVSYGDKVSDFENKEIYIVDFSFKLDVVKNMMKKNNVTIIDHHVSAKRELSSLGKNFIYNVDKSGATLCWEYLFPNIKTPILLQYIEDRDLWKNKMDNSKEILAYIDSEERSFKSWNNMMKMLEDYFDYHECLMKGRSILNYKNRSIEHLLDKQFKISILNYKVSCVNTMLYNSEIGNILSKENSFGATYYFDGEKYIFSLRSSNNIDVSKIAKFFGGGGHKNASGFSIKNIKNLNGEMNDY